MGSVVGLASPTASARAFPAAASPTLSTNLSALTVHAGGSIYDTASLTGFASGTIGGGTVTYYLYPGNNVCSASGGVPTTVSTVLVSPGGAVPHSAAETFNTVGSDSWDANYSGNSNNNPAWSPCEPMNVTAANDTITTSLSALSITAGGSVYDTASLAGASSNAGGSVDYEYFTGGSCVSTPVPVSTVAVASAVVPNSASQVFATSGTYGWKAVYSGDSNDAPSTSSCEPLTVNPAPASPTLTTNLSVNPVVVGHPDSDSATLAGATLTATGTIQFELFGNGTCRAPSELVSSAAVSGPGTYPSSSHVFLSVGAYSWEAVYSGDASNHPATSPCEPLLVNKTSPILTTDLNVTANITGNFQIPTSTSDTSPCGIAFNPSDGHLYATLFGASRVQDISGITNATVGSFSVGPGPCAITYDSNNHDLYVADTNFFSGSGSVSVTSGASLVTTVPIPASVPEDVAFDPVDDEVYVGSYMNPQITLICDGGSPCGGSPNANKVVGTVNLGAHRAAAFGAVVVDPTNGRVFVPVQDTVSGKYFVAVISGGTVITNISVPVGLGSDNGVFDPSNGDVYLSNDWLFAATVVVVSGTTDTYVGAVSLIHPNGGTAGDVAVDSATGDVIASQPHGDLNFLTGTSILNHLPYPADSVAYDAANGEVFLGYYLPPTSYIQVLNSGFVVTDSAQLTGATLTATGTITYEYFAGNACSGTPTVVSTVPFAGNPVGKSTPRFFPSESYSYVAVYSGDANNAPTTSACEPFVPTILPIGPFTHIRPFVSFSNFLPSSILVTDPVGAKTGFLPNGTAVTGTWGAVLGGSRSGPGFVSLPNASLGQYLVTLTGSSNPGPSSGSTLLVQEGSENGTETINATYQGSASPGEVETFDVTVSSSDVTIRLVSDSGGKTSPATTGFLNLPGDDGYLLVGGLAAAAVAGGIGLSLRRKTPPRTRS